MPEQQTIHYELSHAADVHRLVSDLPEIEARTIIVALDSGSAWHATDLELARLVAAARTWNKRLIAERGNGSAAERAMLLGFQDLAVVSDSIDAHRMEDTSSIDPSSEAQTAVLSSLSEEPTAVISPLEKFHSTANLATYKPADATRAMPWTSQQNEEAETQASPREVPNVSQPVSYKSRSSVTRTTGALSGSAPEAAAPVADVRPAPVAVGRTPSNSTDSEYEAAAAPPPGRGRKIAKIAAAVLAPILVIGVVAVIAAYTLPTAEVTLVPREETISSSLTYGVTTADQSFDISMDPTPFSSTSTAEASREATGERYEPVGTASGVIQITNPLTHEVTIPAGTEIPASSGVMYYTAEDAHLPAADPYGSMSFGSGSVGVYAGVIGPDGNLDAGVLTGQLGNQMFYTNPEAISGGRMDRFTVITEDDIAAVRDHVADELQTKAQEEFLADIPDDLELVPDSIEIGDPEIEVNGSAGEDGEAVSASGSISVSGKLYNPDELHQMASNEADRALARQGGSERILLAETVSLKEPTSLDTNIPAFQINVEATARTMITDAERNALIEELVGLSRAEAEAVIADHPKVDRYQISIEPDWLLDRMPEISSRINVHVSSGEPTASR